MTGEALKIIKAVYDGNRSNAGGSRAPQHGFVGETPNLKGQKQGASTPNFGIKGRAPLKNDTFQKSETEQPMYIYKNQTMTKDQVKAKSYSDVYKHEAAHLAKAGKYATSGINIDFDGNGFAVGGHVNIAMPSINPDNLDETINHASTVIASAEAPASFDELSDADKNVAAKARSVKAQALAMKGNQSKGTQGGKRINYMA